MRVQKSAAIGGKKAGQRLIGVIKIACSGALWDRFQKKNQISEKSSGKFYFDILTMKIFFFLFSDPYKLVKIMFSLFGP